MLASTRFHPLNHGFTEFYGHYNGAIDYFSRERFGQLDWHRNFDAVHEEGYSTDLIGAAAVEFIEQQDSNSPFYMYVACNAPHSPIQAKRESSPILTPPEQVADCLRSELSMFAEIRGPKSVTSLPKPDAWPPREWRLPEEPSAEDAR